MSKIPSIFHFSIFRENRLAPKREAERYDLMHLLLRLDEFMKFTDVTFGQDPPDFIFHHKNGSIGAELTDLNPRVFEKHGHTKRAEFKSFEAMLDQKPSAEGSFSWDVVSPRQSIEAIKGQLKMKREKAGKWASQFADHWLLIHAAAGNPFAMILNPTLKQVTPDTEKAMAAHVAKLTHAIHSICQDIEPFSNVILFRRSDRFSEFLAFSPLNSNPYNLPMPKDEILNHASNIPDAILDLKHSHKTGIKKWTW